MVFLKTEDPQCCHGIFSCVIFLTKKFMKEINGVVCFKFEEVERKRARSEYETMLLRQDLEAEELKNSSEAALKELQQLQVSECETT